MTTPRNRDANFPPPPGWDTDWPPSLPRHLPQTYDADKTASDTPTQDTPAEPPADGVAQGIRDEDGNTPPTPTLTPAPVPLSRVNYICRFLLPHSEMLPKL